MVSNAAATGMQVVIALLSCFLLSSTHIPVEAFAGHNVPSSFLTTNILLYKGANSIHQSRLFQESPLLAAVDSEAPPSLDSVASSNTISATTNNNNNHDDPNTAVTTLASTILAMLAGDEASAEALAGGAVRKQQMIKAAFEAYDDCASGVLSREEAQALFTNLSRSIVTELATGSSTENGSSKGGGVARAHAQRVLADDESGDTISRVATKLMLLADDDGDGRISLMELAGMFETVYDANSSKGNSQNSDNDEHDSKRTSNTFPQPLRALAGSLQLLPPTEGTDVAEYTASNRTADEWHMGVPGDDHTLRQVSIGHDLSVVGLGRSADASAYFLPELGLVLDAGINVKSLAPKTVLLTHGHRDHIAALPTHFAFRGPKSSKTGTTLYAPKRIVPLIERFLLAEAQLNYGDPSQTDEETMAALGPFDIRPVRDGMEILLPKTAYQGSPTPIGIQVFEAPHKSGVPAVSYGIYRSKTRLKEEYAHLPKNELGALLRDNKNITLTEHYAEGLLFYTGDTTISLLRERWRDILPKYPYMIHEVTFLGMPSAALDATTAQKGHTHYAQLHPWISAFPDTTFILVHWSLRYSKQDVLDFFEEQYGGVPKNVVLWI